VKYLRTSLSKRTLSKFAEAPSNDVSSINIRFDFVALLPIVSIDGIIRGVWNTTVGGNSLEATPGLGMGQYPIDQTPANACDIIPLTKYTSFGWCSAELTQDDCGANTGFYVELQRGPSVIGGLKVCTANNLPERDPLTISLEGSNLSGTVLTQGSSWMLIYQGPSGLLADLGRYTCGPMQSLNNTIAYKSYRFLVLSKRGAESSTQYADIQLFGY
jgi:hypothetical protein